MNSAHNRIPIIKLWSLLVVPLQGEVTDELALHLSTDVLERIHSEGCSGLVLDITGLWMLDSHLCAVLAELAGAASLMGARTLISGMSPEIALTLETMGVHLGQVTTTLDLEAALYTLGVRVVEGEHDGDGIVSGTSSFDFGDDGKMRDDTFGALPRLPAARGRV